MWTRVLLTVSLILGGWVFLSPPPVQAECRIISGTPTYTPGQVKDLTCNTSGVLQTSAGSGGGTNTATASAAAPTNTEGASASLWVDLGGLLNVAVQAFTVLISGEDQTNNLLMTSGGAVRQTLVAGPVSTNTTSATNIIPVGNKSIQGRLVCNAGASTNCSIDFEVFGSAVNSTTGGVSLCSTQIPTGTATISGTCPVITANFSYYWIVTYNVAGTSPVLNVYAMY